MWISDTRWRSVLFSSSCRGFCIVLFLGFFVSQVIWKVKSKLWVQCFELSGYTSFLGESSIMFAMLICQGCPQAAVTAAAFGVDSDPPLRTSLLNTSVRRCTIAVSQFESNELMNCTISSSRTDRFHVKDEHWRCEQGHEQAHDWNFIFFLDQWGNVDFWLQKMF